MKKALATYLLSWSVIGSALPAFAQDNGAQSTQATAPSDDIVVTARKREERLQDVPIAITAFTDTALRDQSVQSLRDIQYQTPSLTVAPNAERNSVAITIRGQNVSDTLLTVDPAVGIYVDGVNFAKTIGNELSTLTDVERVEILKGPQGTLFGRNTTGGAISLTTRLPTGTFGGEVTVRGDEYRRLGGSLVLNLPLAGEDLALRLVGSYDRRDTLGKNLIDQRGIGGDLDGGSARATLLWRPSDRIELVLRGDYARSTTTAQTWKARGLFTDAPGSPVAAIQIASERGGAAFLDTFLTVNDPACAVAAPSAACLAAFGAYGAALADAQAAYVADGQTRNFQDTRLNPFPSRARATSWGGSATATFDLSDAVQLKSITSYRALDRSSLVDLDGSTYDIFTLNTITTQKLFQQEGQLLGTAFDRKLTWIVGGFYSRETGNDGTRTVVAPFLTGGILGVIDGDVINTSLAGFAQATFAVTDRLSLTGGLRYTRDHKVLVSRNRSGDPVAVECNVPNPVAGRCEQRFADSWTDLSYTAVIDYKLAPDVLLYVKTSRGYRSGGFNLRGSSDPASFRSFAPERVTDYEAGLKAEFLDRRVRLNIAGYRSDYRNVQRSVFVPSETATGVATVVENAARGRIYGVEAELTVRPTDRLTLASTGAFTDARYSRYVDGFGRDLSGLKFTQVPRWTYSGTVAYAFPISGGDLRVQADYAWRSDIYYFPESLFNGTGGLPDLRGQRAYGLLNARISKHFDAAQLDVAIFARNLLSRKYYAANLDASDTVGINVAVPGEPRIIGFEVNLAF